MSPIVALIPKMYISLRRVTKKCNFLVKTSVTYGSMPIDRTLLT